MENYFVKLFTVTNIDWSQVTNCIVYKVTRTRNDLMLAEVEENEVKAALFNMHPDKFPRPDDMIPGFYQKCWNIVKTDMVNIVQYFFERAELMSS